MLDAKITLSMRNASIQEILDTLTSYDNVKFSYINDELPLQNKVGIEVTDQSLKVVLDSIFLNQGIQYIVVSKQIVLKKEERQPSFKKNIFDPNKVDRWCLSLFFGRGISYRILRSNNDQLVNLRNTAESPKGNYTGGAYLTFSLSSAFSLRSGLAYISAGEKGSYSYSLPSDSAKGNGNGNNGNGNGNGGNGIPKSGKISYINNYSYLSVPLMIGHSIKRNKWMFSGFAGIGAAFLLSYSTKYPDNNKGEVTEVLPYSTVSDYKFKKQAIIFPVTIEAGYRLNNNWGISGAFSFNYFASSIYTASAQAKSRPYNLNAQVGFIYFPSK
jgi:hypothetical protein